MTSFKYLVCVSLITFMTTLIILGCGSQRATTKFELTPTMEDSVTTADQLSKELEEELKLEDAKRIKMLQEKEQGKKEKEGKPAGKKAEEMKSVESKEVR
ncbi:MAG: hypothetical protein ACE5GU_08930 [Candidatus Scalinduaceae bacterium]